MVQYIGLVLLILVVIYFIAIIQYRTYIKALDAVLQIIRDAQTERQYLLDRIQTGDADRAKALNSEPRKTEPKAPSRVDLGTAVGLEVAQAAPGER
ncbi:MAG TPA: hypothetical protein PL004_12825 [Bacillota bacterium]|nr:hypothetical protein [Bacillota bacterium]